MKQFQVLLQHPSHMKQVVAVSNIDFCLKLSCICYTWRVLREWSINIGWWGIEIWSYVTFEGAMGVGMNEFGLKRREWGFFSKKGGG